MPSYVELDTDTLLDAVDRALNRGLKQLGDDVADDAAGSLQHRNRPSRPGEVPSIWGGSLQQIRATVDGRTNSVVIAVEPQPGRQGGGLVPQILEAGGLSDDGNVIEARPFLVPALKRQLERQVPGIWRDTLR